MRLLCLLCGLSSTIASFVDWVCGDKVEALLFANMAILNCVFETMLSVEEKLKAIKRKSEQST